MAYKLNLFLVKKLIDFSFPEFERHADKLSQWKAADKHVCLELLACRVRTEPDFTSETTNAKHQPLARTSDLVQYSTFALARHGLITTAFVLQPRSARIDEN